MNPNEQRTTVVLERLYAYLLMVKTKRQTANYADCFRQGFGIPYEKKFCHFIQLRTVVNNIPYILGAFGRACNDFPLPPLCCLVVRKKDHHCGGGVITSREVAAGQEVEFAERIDRPNVYKCNDYPLPGTPKAKDLLNRVIEHLRKKIKTNE